MTHGQFVQARFLIELIFDALQKSLLIYCQDDWRNDFDEFTFVLDGKLPGKLDAGEKYLSDVVVPALGSLAAGRLILVDTWHREPQHPFITKFWREHGQIRGKEVTGVIDLSAVFDRGLTFGASREHAGVQLADAVAHIVRVAVLEPDNRSIQLAYDELRHSLRNDHRRCLSLRGLTPGAADLSSTDRYQDLIGPRRPH
jgi:hypothetical protein